MDKISKIIWTESGLLSLEEILNFISKDSEFYSGNFGKRILNLAENLEYFPYLGRIVPEYNNKVIRELIYQNYRLVYKIEENNIYIIYIGHGAKLLPDINET